MGMNKASGSIWNPNSWHWENKNYTKEATEYIRSKILDHSFKKGDITFILTDIKKLKGEAEICIRKGKQIICYEFEMEVNFRGETELDECDGVFKLHDLNQADMDFDIQSISITNAGEIGSKARSILKKCLPDKIIELFKDMKEDLMKYENNPEKLKEDQNKRVEAKKLTAEVFKEKGEI